MRFAFCVESDTDAEILRVVLAKILRAPIQADAYQFPRGGFSQALRLAPRVARRAALAGLDGALFAIDNDGKPEHGGDQCIQPTCRVCQLRKAASIDEPLAWPRDGGPRLRYLFAVPVQTIETWLLVLSKHPFSGPPEHVGADGAGRKLLKRLLYGHEAPTERQTLDVAIPLAEQLVPQDLAARSRSFALLFNQR